MPESPDERIFPSIILPFALFWHISHPGTDSDQDLQLIQTTLILPTVLASNRTIVRPKILPTVSPGLVSRRGLLIRQSLLQVLLSQTPNLRLDSLPASKTLPYRPLTSLMMATRVDRIPTCPNPAAAASIAV